MRRFLLFVMLMLAVSGVLFAQLDLKMDAERDEYYNTLTGPDEGYIFMPYYAISQDFSAPDDNVDLSAFCWLAWDPDYLYFYAEVTDDYVVVNNATTYENDAIELKMDPDPLQETTSGVAAVRLSAWGEDDADEPAGVDNLVAGNELDVPFEPVEGEDYARKETDFGYNLEFRLPWTSIVRSGKEVDVSVGGIFGLAINVMDNDSDHREHVLQWSAGMQDAVWSNPQLHGTVTFLDSNKLKLEPFNSAGGDAVNDSAHWYIPPPPAAVANEPNVILGYELKQNYPNPFNPTTAISFALPRIEHVTLTILDVTGRQVRTLISESYREGLHSVVWDGKNDQGVVLPSGVYLYRLKAGQYLKTNKMTFLQ